MDWFHCNQCFSNRGSKFAVTSCGHICCEACYTSNHCNICKASCSYLPITDDMKPQEKVFFKDPVKLIESRLQHISQVALFQRKQMEKVIAHFRHKSDDLERHLKEVTEQSYRQVSCLKKENSDLKQQLSVLKRENAELKKPLSQRRVSPAQLQTNGVHRMSLPVAVTSPVVPHMRTMSQIVSAESQDWSRYGSAILAPLTTPGSATSLSSHSSHGHRTPATSITPSRIQRQTPHVFQFMGGLSIRSPRY